MLTQIHKTHAHFKSEASCPISVPATCILPLNAQQATQKFWDGAVSEAPSCVPGALPIEKKRKKEKISYSCLEIKEGLAEAGLLKLM